MKERATAVDVTPNKSVLASWGYSPFLARSGVDEGDVLIVELDLVERNAMLRLGDDEILDELNP